jgi:hypothetical protein
MTPIGGEFQIALLTQDAERGSISSQHDARPGGCPVHARFVPSLVRSDERLITLRAGRS